MELVISFPINVVAALSVRSRSRIAVIHAHRFQTGNKIVLHPSRSLPSRKPTFSILALAGLLLVAACNKPTATQPAATSQSSHGESGIQWLKGDVDAAFAAARAQHKPVFLYWGAIWCPPCQQLKATVFSRPDFIAKTRLFVPVYLDGDETSAQKWGEAFRVQGYPTLVILDADKHEVMRLAGGMDLSQYASVLDTALADLAPVDSTLASASATQVLSATTCNRLAFNAWTLEDLGEQEFATRAAQLAQLSSHCLQAAPVAGARLAVFAAYFQAAAEAPNIAKGVAPSKAMRDDIDLVQTVLKQYGNDAKLADALQTLDENFFKAVRAADQTSGQAVRDAYIAAMDAESKDNNLAEADHLSALGRKLLASRVLSAAGKWPEQYVSDARARIDAVLQQHQTPYVRSSILNSVLNVYDELKLYQAAYDLVKTELPKAEHPYYLKGDLAEIAEELGRKDEALMWRDQAYKEAEGTATRFQWGQRYASALMRLQPQDTQRITDVTTQVLTELDGPDRIYRRARLGLERLDKDLNAWNKAANNQHSAVLKSLHTQLQQVCGKIPANESARGSCDLFLASG
jgi:thiol-disulfide isomerase/thioredoxin